MEIYPTSETLQPYKAILQNILPFLQNSPLITEAMQLQNSMMQQEIVKNISNDKSFQVYDENKNQL